MAGSANNSEALRSALATIGWSQQRLADWLSEVTGDRITRSRIESWLAGANAAHKRGCPGWPLALLRCYGLV